MKIEENENEVERFLNGFQIFSPYFTYVISQHIINYYNNSIVDTILNELKSIAHKNLKLVSNKNFEYFEKNFNYIKNSYLNERVENSSIEISNEIKMNEEEDGNVSDNSLFEFPDFNDELEKFNIDAFEEDEVIMENKKKGCSIIEQYMYKGNIKDMSELEEEWMDEEESNMMIMSPLKDDWNPKNALVINNNLIYMLFYMV